ncbi:MAG: CBS domain-containing protein [Frankiaceae bacterium]|nr:CBS domain-containing protein [Frankiaceae bacterium]
MLVRDVMTSAVLTVGPAHTVRQVAQAMAARRVGAAVVLDPDSEGPGILTERDVLEVVAGGQDLDVELAGDHLTPDAVSGEPDWDLEKAAGAMVSGGFRHLVICEGSEVVGVLSVRDIVKAWTGARAR